MKRIGLFLLMVAALVIAACSSHPNNGEIPPASELPTLFPASQPAASVGQARTNVAPVRPASPSSAPATASSTH